MTDELPRGATLSTFQNGSGIAAAIVVPAVPGVAHVLDSIDASVKEYVALGAATAYILRVVDGPLVLFQWDLILIPSNGDQASQAVSGPNIASISIGGQMVVQFTTVAGAGVVQNLTIQWHDI